MRVGLLGGTFDPIHNGHLRLATEAVRQLKLDRIYLVPAARSPFKRDQAPLSTAKRMRLLKAAMEGRRRVRIATWELRRPAPSYTIDTLRRYRKTHPRDEIFLLIGSDALAGFRRWKKARAILGLCTLAVARRPGTPRIARPFSRAVALLKGRFPAISSTELRRDLTAGRSVRGRMPPKSAALARAWYGHGSS